ncbi:uncharacterized protein [Zea mays]|uniref:Uncharacterized protein n=1 Tax=Zea mays TaxID=4577 RepID=A0A1D6I0B8_MAIZE|nr:uncharacterized protein LOC103632397 [Zea mays]ONM53724.1 hypothetical protein ZEAMMB73_Zm00001d019788 [Zea mays]|eukprot:XP_008652455.1 uncharacterized protein LOC103632397 [Zea mays]
MARVPPALGARLLHFGWPALVAVVAMSAMAELPVPLLHGTLHSDLLPLGSPIRAPKQRLSLPLSIPNDKQQGLPLLHIAVALPFFRHSPHRVSSLSCSLRSSIRDAVEIRASGRHHASCFARSTKCRAMWTAHVSSLIPFRLIDL